jgi:hypothetical protein
MNDHQWWETCVIVLDTDNGVPERVYNYLVGVAKRNRWEESLHNLSRHVDGTDGSFYLKEKYKELMQNTPRMRQQKEDEMCR